jgi:NADH-quinone oxidoreductase subunit L
MFHLMTHAFFKALLFMGAGSVIGAMAGEQNIDRMGGFRRSMPFTFVTFTVGALALAGFPGFSGFFSKDSILAGVIHRGGGFTILGVVGYVAALFTAFYAFRMVFRVFLGSPVPEAASLERGEVAHGEPRNPMTGEEEDTDIGFPGPEHLVAEQERPMRAAMGPLALLALAGGWVAVPGLTNAIDKFLQPTFADSAHYASTPSTKTEWIGLAVGGAVAIVGIAAAWFAYVRRPGLTLALRERLPRLHDFLEHKWYFDELYDLLFVRPTLAFANWARTFVEGGVVQDVIGGGAARVVGASTAVARTLQSGYIRGYALLLLVGVGALGLYFLLVSS